jgi:DNA-binding CsgD family transcriptional regulator/PAS domain-containing protein
MPETTTQDLASIIGGIYECALDPDQWGATLNRVTACLNAAFTSIALLDAQFNPRLVVSSSWDEDMTMRLHADFTPDDIPGSTDFVSDDLDTPFSSIDRVGEPIFQASRFYKNWAGPQYLRDVAVAKFVTLPDRLGVVTIGTAIDRAPVTAAERQFIATLCPHLRRAIMIGDLLDQSRVYFHAFRATLDTLNTPVLLVNADAAIVYSNHQAEDLLRKSDILQSKSGVLTPTNPATAAPLSYAIRRAEGNALDISSKGLGVPVSEPGRPAAVAYVMPLPVAAQRSTPSRPPVAAIFIAMSLKGTPPDPDVLKTLYDLTPAETRVMLAIGGGGNLADAAVECKISENTAKTHLSRIFNKTATNKQTDIANLVAALAAPAGGFAGCDPG